MKNIFKTTSTHFETKEGDKILTPFGPSIFQSQVDSNFTKALIEEGRKLTLKDDDWNNKLAGHLKYGRSYHYKKEFVAIAQDYIGKYVFRYLQGITDQWGQRQVSQLLSIPTRETGGTYDKNKMVQGELKLESLWINFSKMGDYNPPHTHSGVLSFVIFCDVPKEIFSVQPDSNTKHAGNIVFQHGEQMTPLMGTDVFMEPYNNLMFIFPAKLIHYVPAYFVDVERISVSGNFIVV